MTRRESKATDPDLVGAEAALRRAARRARETAGSTGTPLVIWRDGRLVREYVDSVGEEAPGYGEKSQWAGPFGRPNEATATKSTSRVYRAARAFASLGAWRAGSAAARRAASS